MVARTPEQIGKDDLLSLAALVESYSDHPISRSLREAWGREIDRARVSSVEEIPGQGRAGCGGRPAGGRGQSQAHGKHGSKGRA